MASISTKHGDHGDTSLVGGVRVSKADLRVEAYGTVDELNSAIGFARSICDDVAVNEKALRIQRELFRVGAMLATPMSGQKGTVPMDSAYVDALTNEVHELEAIKELLSDWSVPGGSSAGAAFDVARTICRRAERNVIRLRESGEAVEPAIVAYLNRLSDLLWLFGRKLETNGGQESSLRAMNQHGGNRWSRAW